MKHNSFDPLDIYLVDVNPYLERLEHSASYSSSSEKILKTELRTREPRNRELRLYVEC
jgi:hypothetical protein